MAKREIKLNATGGPLVVTLTIGQAGGGNFAIYLFDAPGSPNFREIGSGSTETGNGSPLVVGPASGLAGRVLAWDVVATPLFGKNVSVFLVATQDGTKLSQFLDETPLGANENKVTIRTGALLK
jgi:hypothetical protein